MLSASFPVLIAWSVAAVFAVAALANLAGPRVLRDAYARWGYSRGFHLTAGVIEATAALFLTAPQTRIWGVAVAAVVLFLAVVTLLNHRQYLYAVPGIVLLAALPPTLLAAAV
jgi:DoxX-like protein